MTILCKCNTCEAIFDRALKQVETMFLDDECVLCVAATSTAIRAIMANVMHRQVEDMFVQAGFPEELAGELAIDESQRAANVIDKKMHDVWAKDFEHYIDRMNAIIDKANKKNEEEQNLPKDT